MCASHRHRRFDTFRRTGRSTDENKCEFARAQFRVRHIRSSLDERVQRNNRRTIDDDADRDRLLSRHSTSAVRRATVPTFSRRFVVPVRVKRFESKRLPFEEKEEQVSSYVAMLMPIEKFRWRKNFIENVRRTTKIRPIQTD